MALTFGNTLTNALVGKINTPPLSIPKANPLTATQPITTPEQRTSTLSFPQGGMSTSASPLKGTTPSTPLKKTTVTHPSGVTVTNEYHAPVSPNGGMNGTPKSPATNSDYAATQAQGRPEPAANQGTFNSTVGQLATPSASPYYPKVNQSISDVNNAAQGNDVYANRAQDIANSAGQQISNIGQSGARAEAGYRTTGTSPVGEGNAAITAQTTAAQQQAIAQGANMELAGNQQGLTAQNQKQSGYNAAGGLANTAQNQYQSSIGSAASLAQPTPNTAYYGSPISGGVYGQGSDLLNSNISKAVQLVQNGTDVNDPSVQGLLSPFGAIGQSAFNQALLGQNSGYNPTNQSAGSQTNAALGAQTAKEAFGLSTALKQVDTLQPVISNFLQVSGINPTDAGVYNTKIDDYIATLGNPTATAQYQTMINDLQNFSSQIVSSGTALTPSGVTAATALQDPSKLSMKQINTYLNTLRDLGSNRLSVLQSQANNVGYTGYTGQQAQPVTSTQVGTPSTAPGAGVTSPAGQFGAGVGLDTARWAQAQAADLGPKLVSFIGGALLK